MGEKFEISNNVDWIQQKTVKGSMKIQSVTLTQSDILNLPHLDAW